jgi:bifunctional DNA-binding transcriptional regulator/antitoxin component of YhaV-PrlF toxin-antitoxin module
MKTTLTIDDNGVLTFTEELIQETGWKEGDMLEFIDNGDSFILRLVDES